MVASSRQSSAPLFRPLFVLPLLALAAAACEQEQTFAKVYQIQNMAQVIGGPAAAGRPADFMLENDKLRAVIHARHNSRSTMPIANGSLIDLDIQRPATPYRAGQGSDAFYELGPQVNLKVNSSRAITHGPCVMLMVSSKAHALDSGGACTQAVADAARAACGTGAEACPAPASCLCDGPDRVKQCEGTDGCACVPLVGRAPCEAGCARVSATGPGEDMMGILSLLDMAITRETFDNKFLVMTTDWDVCPGEPYVRANTTAQFQSKVTQDVPMNELLKSTGLMDVLLGESSGKSCEQDSDCAGGEKCESLLLELSLGSLAIKMRRCRAAAQKQAGILAGDLTMFSAKVNIFVPGSGFDHESYIRSVFDAGGDTFSAPLSVPYIAGVADGVSYAYFNATGLAMVPVFTEAFTATMTNSFACPRDDDNKSNCLQGKGLRFTRFVSVGQGDVASALEGFYRVRKIPTGQVAGHVMDRVTRKAVSGMNVFVFREPLALRGLTDEELGARLSRTSVAELEALERAESATAKNPAGDPGVISQFSSDRGLDFVPDGSFGGPLPFHADWCNTAGSCRYILVARDGERTASALVAVRIRPDEEAPVTLVAGDTATLQFVITDGSGRPLPSKLTIGRCFAECAVDADCSGDRPVCDLDPKNATALAVPEDERRGLCMPASGYTGSSSCRPDQTWDAARKLCLCPESDRLPLYMAGHRYADGTTHVRQTTSGKGEVALEPGSYQVVVSRGLEYDIHRAFVQLKPGAVGRLFAALHRVVDTRGWISADFHVHGPNSPDASALYRPRITTFVSEGVELLSATDHDCITDYSPTIREMGMQPWLKSQISMEVSPLDYGHFIGFPLRYDANKEQNGGFHWRRNKTDDEKQGDAAWIPDYLNLKPGEIFQNLRTLGSLGMEKTVVFVAHFYDHLTFYEIDPWTLEPPTSFFSPIGKLFSDVLKGTNFSGAFDALEGFNGKNLDIIRRPTYQEVRDYNLKLAAFLQKSSTWGYDRRQRAWGQLSAEAQRGFIKRTAAEQKLAIDYGNSSFQCRCASDAECGQDALCDEIAGACVARASVTRCTSDSSCAAALVTAKREQCQTLADSITGGKFCRRVDLACAKDADCTTVFGKDAAGKDVTETCIAKSGKCGFACSFDSDCKKDPLRPVCDTAAGACTMVTAATASDPCPMLRGTVDDWFQLLNKGIRRPFLGNSDTHDTYGTEAGIPRNFVRSGSDQPMGIREDEIAANVKAMRTFPTYGPFVQFSLADPAGKTYEMGEMATVDKGKQVSLKLRVQSPLWFDVDRIEIYKNGALLKEIDGRADCAPGSPDCIRSPNDQVVNFDGEITDTVTTDAWYVATVMGVNGKTLAPVYSSTPVSRLGMYELIQRLTPLLPPLVSFRTPLSPSMTTVRPYALTNPIYVDADGGGFKPLGKLPTWATDADKQAAGQSTTTSASSTAAALTRAGEGPGQPGQDQHSHPPGHDHRHGIGRMLLEARDFQQHAREGQITAEMVARALDSLRYMSFRP